MLRGASGDECGNLLGQEYNRPAREAGVLKKPREATFYCYDEFYLFFIYVIADSNSVLLCGGSKEKICGRK
jgi:hypothetical protein